MNLRQPIAVALTLSLLVPLHPVAWAQPAAGQGAKPKTVREELPAEAQASWDRALELFQAKKWDGAQAEFWARETLILSTAAGPCAHKR